MESQRRSTQERRIEIIEATLSLAEQMPIAQITTRKIAKQVGISQPALFRHFTSSNHIFENVIEHVKSAIGSRATEYFKSEDLQQSDLKTKLMFIMKTLSAFPGLPKFFYFYTAQVKPSPARSSLMHLLSMIQTMISTLIREDPAISGQLDEELAARYLISLIQGQQIGFDQENTASTADPVVFFRETIEQTIEFWFEALKSGLPKREKEAPVTQAQIPKKNFINMDVRPSIREGKDPLDAILSELQGLAEDGCLRLTTPFKPNPLIALLESQGYKVWSSNEQATWVSIILNGKGSFFDFTDFEAPIPLEKTLELVHQMGPGQHAWAHVPKVPNLLFPHLEKHAVKYQVYLEESPPVLIQLIKKGR